MGVSNHRNRLISVLGLSSLFLQIFSPVCLGILTNAGMGMVSPQATHAAFVHDDNQGFFSIDFADAFGLAADGAPLRERVDQDYATGTITIASGETRGYFTTSTIAPASFASWDEITFNGILPSSAEVRVSLYDCADPTPSVISGWENVLLSGSSLDISSLPASYECIRPQVLLDQGSGTIAPIINELRVTWEPLPVFLVGIQGKSETDGGSTLTYSVPYSVSYSDATDAVLWVELPDMSNGQISNYTGEPGASTYGLDFTPTFENATSGGQYTDTEITLNGTTIPAHAVYWDLGNLSAGVTNTTSFTLSTASGWEDGVTYHFTSSIDSAETNVKNSAELTTIFNASPSPTIEKTVSGTIRLNNQNRVYSGQGYSSDVIYHIKVGNTGNESIFNPTVRDDLTDIYDKLQNQCAVVDPSTRISNITPAATSFVGAEIQWDLGTLVKPNENQKVSFSVDYAGCPDDLEIDNTGYFDGVNITEKQDSEAVVMNVDLTPTGTFAKGDFVDFAGISPYDDNAGKSQTYGDRASYILWATNPGLVRLDDVIMVDKIPDGLTFFSASLPANVNGTIFYSVSGATNEPDSPPTYTYTDMATGVDFGDWTVSAPADLSTVTWVAFYVPCLSSYLFESPEGSQCYPTGGVPVPSSFGAQVNTTIDTPADVCESKDIQNVGNFYVYSAANDLTNEDADVVEMASPTTYTEDTEYTHVRPPLADLSVESSMTGPKTLNVETEGTYTIKIKNTGADTALNTRAEIHLPEIEVNGETAYLDFVNAMGGNMDISRLNSDGIVTIEVGDLPVGLSKTVSVKLSVPKGVFNQTNFKVVAKIKAEDDEACQEISTTKQYQTTVEALPQLFVKKKVNEAIITSGSDIHYILDLINSGNAPSRDTFIAEPVPAKTVFQYAMTNGSDDNGNDYTCGADCEVYFSDGNGFTSNYITTENPFTPADIFSKFSLGSEVTTGSGFTAWESPFGEDTKYVAWRMDEAATTPLFPTDKKASVGLIVKNDHDGPGSETFGSPVGTLIYNYAATASSELLQAVSNQVYTAVLPDPGLNMEKISDVDYIYAGGDVEWRIDYFNNSKNANTNTVITDTLPYGVTLDKVYHTWNEKAQMYGLSGTETDITDDAHVDINKNADGTTTIEVDIAQGLRGDDLLSMEGGTIRVTVTTDDNLETYTFLTNQTKGCYENSASAYCLTKEDDVQIQNPDLWLRKLSDIQDPIAGDTVHYTLILSNEGLWEAPDVMIRDTLPQGLCYQGGTSSVMTGGWSFGEPTSITYENNDCTDGETYLIWDSVIDHTDYPAGTIPAESEDIYLRYDVQVDSGVAIGTDLTNIAETETTISDIAESHENNDDVTVTVPRPDPYVTKDAPIQLNSGENLLYTVSYGNLSKQTGRNTYLIDALPTALGGDNAPDLQFISASGTHNETFYYFDQVTDGTPTMPTSGQSPNSFFGNATNNWTTTAPTNPTHIAIVPENEQLAGYAGPYRITIELRAVDPLTGNPVGASLEFINEVNIVTDEEDPTTTTDNTDTAVSRTPGYDLYIEKTADHEGVFPGIAPGKEITYTVKFGNQGTEPACAVKITENFPTNFVPRSPVSNFTTLELTDGNGNPTVPQDRSRTNINSTVNIEYNAGTHTWYLGGTSDYQDVCLQPGQKGSFEIYGKIATTAPDFNDSAQLEENVITIGHDDTAVGTEIIPENNIDQSSVAVYLADVMVNKSGVSCGDDNICGTSDDDATLAEPGDTIEYTIEYDNIGNIAAEDVVINEIIPDGTCYKVGSVEAMQPAGTTLEYSNDNGITWNYIPSDSGDGTDCGVTNFRVMWDTDLMAPGNSDTDDFIEVDNSNQYLKTEIVDETLILSNEKIIKISAGTSYSHILSSDGTVWSVGQGVFLGTGAHENSDTFVPITDLNNVIDIVAGKNHSLALLSDGTVWSWGDNRYGQLGDGTTQSRNRPVKVVDGLCSNNNIRKISVGLYHSLALKEDGTVCSWGMSGQLGDGTTTNQSSPVKVKGADGVGFLTDVVDVAGNWFFATALKSDGTLWAWENRGYPTQIASDIAYITEGEFSTGNPHSVAVKLDGTIYSSGYNVYGSRNVSGLSDVVQAEVGDDYSLILKSDGTVWAVGLNDYGQLGDGGFYNQTTPIQVKNPDGSGFLENIVEISAGNTHAMARDSFGSIYSWGDNTVGQLGFDSEAHILPQPISIANGDKVAAGWNHSLILKNDGTVQSCGYNGNGQLGDGTMQSHPTPVQVSGLTDVQSLAGNRDGQSYALKNDGTVWAWGINSRYQLGDGTSINRLTPVQTLNLSGITKIASGGNVGLALKNNGTVWAWGGSSNGAACSWSTYVGGPSVIPSLSNVIDISAGNMHSTYLLADGTVWSCGEGDYGQLGHGSTTDSAVPVQASGLTGVIAIASGSDNSYALKSDGTVWAWGGSPAIGNGVLARALVPTQVMGLTNVSKIFSTDSRNIFALKSDGTLWAWGSNYNGMLGDGTTNTATTPIQVKDPSGVGYLTDIISLEAGSAHTVAVDSTGQVFTWGRNSYGQLCDGSFTKSSLPLSINLENIAQGGIFPDGTYKSKIQSENLLSWDKLLVTQDIPNGTSITYELLENTCTTSLFGPVTTETGVIDISSIDSSNTELCLQIALNTNIPETTPALDDWTITYISGTTPNFSFQSVAQNQVSDISIDNTVSINTTTPELDYTNNQGAAQLILSTTDMEITKTVDHSVGHTNDTLIYTLEYINNGPSVAENFFVKDQLPAYLNQPTSITPSQTSKGKTVQCQYFSGDHRVVCGKTVNGDQTTVGDLAVEESGTITITATVNTTPQAGDMVVNTTQTSSETNEADTTNNTDTAITVIADLPNVYLQKTGQTTVEIGKEMTYTITYGNNGNAPADGVVITDTLDTHTNYVSSNNANCLHSGGVITCTLGTLAAGFTDTIEITVTVDNDPTLLGDRVNLETAIVLQNEADITTTSEQLNILDDWDDHETTPLGGALTSISGRVFGDTNGNLLYESQDGEQPLENITILLAGKSDAGELYGPDKDLFPEAYEALMAETGQTINATDPYPSNYHIVEAAITDESGLYNFSGLEPGTYHLMEVQPSEYISLGSTSGYMTLDGSGSPVASPQDGIGSAEGHTDPDQIVQIQLLSGEISVENNFAEALGTIGDFVWFDIDGDGIFNNTDYPLANVEIKLYQDTDNDSVGDTLLQTTLSDETGYYEFSNLPLDDGLGNNDADYVVVVTDALNVLTALTSIHTIHGNATTSGGNDNEAKDPSGYAVTLSLTNTASALADFGYTGETGLVGDTIYFDTNQNGIYDDGDTPIVNAEVTIYRDINDDGLLDINDIPVESTLTDINGHYAFDSLVFDKYVVTVTDSENYVQTFTSTHTASNTGNNDDGQDPSGFAVELSDLSPQEIGADFGYYGSTGTIGNRLWYDEDQDGIYNNDDTALANVELSLFRDTDGDGVGDTLLATTLTDVNGEYLFTNLPLDDNGGDNDADYVVTITDRLSILTGLTSTHLAHGHATDSDGSESEAKNPNGYAVALTSGTPNNTFADFGYEGTVGSVGDTIYFDTNQNGIYDEGDTPIANVEVSVYRDMNEDGLLDSGDLLSGTTATGIDGVYTISNIPFGKYITVVSDSDYYIQSFTSTHSADSSGTNEDGQDPTGYAIELSDTNPQEMTADFGYFGPTGSIGNQIWYDENQDGVYNNNDTALANVEVSLYRDTDGDGVGDTLLATTLTSTSIAKKPG